MSERFREDNIRTHVRYSLFRRNAYKRMLAVEPACVQCGLGTAELHLIERKMRACTGDGGNPTLRFLSRMNREFENQMCDLLCFACLLRRVCDPVIARRAMMRTVVSPNLGVLVAVALGVPVPTTMSFSFNSPIITKGGEYSEQLRNYVAKRYFNGNFPVNESDDNYFAFWNKLRNVSIKADITMMFTGHELHLNMVQCAKCGAWSENWTFDHIFSPWHANSNAITSGSLQAELFAAFRDGNLRVLCAGCDMEKSNQQRWAWGILNRWKRGNFFYETKES